MKKLFDTKAFGKYFATVAIAAATLFACPLIKAMPSDAERPVAEMSVQPSIRIVDGHVEINLPGDEPRQVAVYSLTGQLVKSLTVEPGVTLIDLVPGYYIVKCDRLSQRVIVR